MLEKSRFHCLELRASLRIPQTPPSTMGDEFEDPNNLQVIIQMQEGGVSP